MANYKVVKAKEEQLDDFYKGWDLTIEGLTPSKESLDQYCEVLTELSPIKEGKELVFYIVSGKQMNDRYELTGHNRYKDNLNIVVCKNDVFENINRIAIPRFMWGGRWFNDIVDNNAEREGVTV